MANQVLCNKSTAPHTTKLQKARVNIACKEKKGPAAPDPPLHIDFSGVQPCVAGKSAMPGFRWKQTFSEMFLQFQKEKLAEDTWVQHRGRK